MKFFNKGEKRNKAKQFDYFQKGYDIENYHIVLEFPYLFHIPLGVLKRNLINPEIIDYPRQLVSQDGPMDLLCSIFTAFKTETGGFGASPTVVLFGARVDLEELINTNHVPRLEPVEKCLDKLNLPYLNSVRILANHYRNLSQPLDIGLYFDKTFHHSALAHRIIADQLAPEIQFLLQNKKMDSNE